MMVAGPDRSRINLGLSLVLFLLGLSLALARVGALDRVGSIRLSAPYVMVDFRHVVYYPTHAFWDGINPYDSGRYMQRYPVEIPVSLYAPATFLLFAPFAALPVGLSSAAYFVLTLFLTAVLANAALRLAGWPAGISPTLAVSGLLLVSRPGHWNLLSGQVTIIVVLATYCALIYYRSAPRLAGIGLALALLKPSFGIPLIPLLLARRAVRATAWGVGLAAALNLGVMTILIGRQGGIAPFLKTVTQSVRAFAANPDTQPILGIWRVDLTALVSRILDYPLSPGAGIILTAVVLIPVMYLSRRLNAGAGSRQVQVIDALTCCAVLLSLFHQAYDLLLLAWPAASLAKAIHERAPEAIYIVQGVLFAILALNYVTTQSVLTAFALSPGLRLGVLTANGLALAGLFGLYSIEASRFQTAGT